MIKGITVNGKHSYYSFGLRMLKRSIGSPPKDDHTERVPYSSVTYDFDSIFGGSSYGERTLTYKFELMDLRLNFAEDRLMAICCRTTIFRCENPMLSGAKVTAFTLSP